MNESMLPKVRSTVSAPQRRPVATTTADRGTVLARAVATTVIMMGGCRLTPVPVSDANAPTPVKALIAQPCPGLKEAHARSPAEFGRVFLEGVDVSSDELPNPLGSWLVREPVTVNHLRGLLANADEPETMSWERCMDKECTSTQLWQLTLTATLPKEAAGAISLTIHLSPGENTHDSGQTLALESRDQQPVVVAFPEGAGGTTSIVFTPYLIASQSDLRLLAECKTQAACKHESGGD